MTNEEKAIEIATQYNYDTFIFQASLEIAEWKERQFKEYLENKKKKIMDNPYSGHCLSDMYLLDEIINEFFKEN